MPARPRIAPSYRLHKPTGQAVVRIDSRDHDLGKFGSTESHGRYHRLIAEWLADGRLEAQAGPGTRPEVSVNELLLAFWHHAERHFRKPDGTPSDELGNFRDSLTPCGSSTASPPPRRSALEP